MHTRLARRLLHNFEYTHRLQLRFHLAMMTFWVLNLVAGTVLLFLSPDLWVRVGVYYVFVLSIYANWDTDYDAVSASQAALHAQELLEERRGAVQPDTGML